MKYLSVCSGIEAATVAWQSLGWEAVAFSEIEKFPRELLNYHYPNTPLHGDFTTIGEKDYGAIDLLAGGTPCQAFSIAGLRQGFADDRGNLTLAFLQLLKRKAPKWMVWENVPGVLSHDKGRTFGAFLGGLGELGYGFAYRVLDAQYFGVPQRRKRVFVVGCAGDWRSASEVLFEPESLRGNITPCQDERENNTRYIISTSHTQSNGLGISNKDVAYTIDTSSQCNQAIYCFNEARGPKHSMPILQNKAPTMTKSHSDLSLYENGAIRRLMPIEVERCFGFSDNYTKISNKTSDGVRYAALGNSMAVPVMRWIGERINLLKNR